MNINDKVAIVIPAFNGEKTIERLIESIEFQEDKYDVLVIDSGSNDKTIEILMMHNINIKCIKQSEFNHGKTRQWGVSLCKNAEIIVFLTQDVILAEKNSIKTLVTCFNDIRVGCAYGRQLPHKDAKPLSAYERCFNYPDTSKVKVLKDAKNIGIKAAFISNSFAAYRKKSLNDIGGFPYDTILCEDMYVAAKMLLKGWKNYYCAEAKVYHSHNYTAIQEFKRCFDIGVFHARNPWCIQVFGRVEREGFYLIMNQIYLMPRKIHFIVWRSIAKFLGYKLGKNENIINGRLKQKISMNKQFWL